MYKLLNWAAVFLFPLCALGLLTGGSSLSTKLRVMPEMTLRNQKQPASVNPARRTILRRQYSFYRRSCNCPVLARRSALLYNQCIEDSDPSVLNGTGLPRRLPVQGANDSFYGQ